MTTSQWQTQRTELENQIKNEFSQLQKKLEDLKNEVQTETDNSKKQEKQSEIQKLEKELAEIKSLVDRLSSLQEQDLQSLKTRIEQYSQIKQDIQSETSDLLNEKVPTPTTYELLKDSPTIKGFEGNPNYPWLLKIIESNPKEFEKIPWNTPEEKLEYIFSKIRNSVILFLKNKLWNSEKYDKVITSTITPAFEWSMLEMLRDQWNKNNVSMLKWMDKITWDSFNDLVSGVSNFAKKTKQSFNKFSQWINAIDYLSVHNWILNKPEKSAVLTSPIEFKNYLNDSAFASENFSPYTPIGKNIFKVDENQTFEFWISLQEKQDVLNQIWNIKVVNNPKTTALIAKMINKPEKFLWATSWLQKVANGLLDWVNSVNSVTKIFGIDLLEEFSKAPEQRSFIYKIIDFVCKLIWITWWLEWIVKRRRLDRLNLTDEKNENISQIFNEYQKLVWKWNDISITDENSCKSVLSEFNLTDLDEQSTTKWDHLRDVISDNIDLNLISPSVVQQTLWEDYLKKEIITVKWKQQEKITVDWSKITETQKREIVHKHIINMKDYLEENYNDLKNFYANIHNTDDLAICMTASLYANKDDVIEWIKAKVFLPENYWVVYAWNYNTGGNEVVDQTQSLSELTPAEQQEMNTLVSQSQSPNEINYLENATYKKYLNVIERDLNLPRYALECVCDKESQWKLYNWDKILWSSAWAKWLFQFMDATADQYMKHKKLWEKYWKTFTSREEFLKDPLASAWAAWILFSEFMTNNWYNFQTSLACYNRWIGHYQDNIWRRNLTSSDLSKLPAETKEYVEVVTQNILSHNSASSSDVLLADLWQYSWQNNTNIETKDLLIWPHLLAKNKDEIWWLWNSIMNWFQWLSEKTNFPNMDWIEWKSTVTHPHRFKSQNDVLAYKNTHSSVKSFMFYFGANTRDNNKTFSDIKQRSEWLQAEWIQPVLCTCIWEDKQTRLRELNQKLISLWKEKNRPVLDFAKSYSKWDIALASDWVHPTSYEPMTQIINWQISQV